ncbi:Protein of unknown function (DUF3445) domain containing protein [Amanita muscaria]
MVSDLLIPGTLLVLVFFFTKVKFDQTAVRIFQRWISGRVIDWSDYAQLSGFPLPRPLPDFQVDAAKPRPYRPFRWEYHQTMSLMALEPDWWLELESTYRERIVQRRGLHEKLGTAILEALPGSEEACQELMQIVIQFLCARYPNQFMLDVKTGVFHNRILDIKCDVREVDPLVCLLDNVPEDFLVVMPDKITGLYHLRAAVSCSAVGWRLREKMGRPLHEIHGPVPFYREKMQFSMDRFFSKMPCNKPIQRGSWSFEIGQPLYLQPGDEEWSHRDTQLSSLKIEEIFLRVDWQTLRRLPKSQAIIFNFKGIFTPVTSFRNEPYIPRLVLKILREAKEPFLEYKSTRHIAHKLMPALEQWTLEQEERGWVPKDWKERTLNEDPFFPNWGSQRDHSIGA